MAAKTVQTDDRYQPVAFDPKDLAAKKLVIHLV